MDWQNLKPHEAANLFPLMTPSDRESLANSIRLNGQLFPIMLTKDGTEVLDGRNRLAAYKLPLLEGLEPWIETYQGSLTPMDYVRSVNWERMHLNQSQRAALAVLLLPEAKRKAAGRERSGKALASTDATVGKAAKEVADQMQVSTAQVERAARIKEEAPEAFEKIKEGKSTVRAEHKKLPKKKRTRGESPSDSEETKAALRLLEALQKKSLDLSGMSFVIASSATNAEYFTEALAGIQETLTSLMARINEENTRRIRLAEGDPQTPELVGEVQ